VKKRLNILVTAGPTQEKIDPVRFISNRSTGVMGYKIAQIAERKRHKVTLISGPTRLNAPAGVKFIPITTTRELKKATLSRLKNSDCLFMVAAVSDWYTSRVSKKKIKRKNKKLKLSLNPTQDILGLAGKRKGKKILVGFSLETKNTQEVSKKKLSKKNLDIIVSNNFQGKRDPFGDKKIKSSFIYKTGKPENLPFMTKKDIARLLLDRVERIYRLRYFGS